MSNFRPSGFSVLPTVVKNLLIINILFFLATIAAETTLRINLSDYLGLHYIGASDFKPYQLVTYMFMHGNFTHLFFNMFALWMFGNTLENIWGPNRFLLFYFVCGIGAGFIQEFVQYIQYATTLADYTSVNMGGHIIPMSEYTTVGASGAVYGILLAFGMMFPNSTLYIYFAIPIKAKWFVLIYGIIELFSGLTSADNVAHFAHLGGMLFGLILILYWKKKGNLY
ncbi:MAG: rhomboid family intramembrane serine protease [Bacteroidales bacterium]|nr:rhomboid family intramembrane serine protease [Bacteroidales bacterium]